jgi:oligopeptide transport system ATP-binding protein
MDDPNNPLLQVSDIHKSFPMPMSILARVRGRERAAVKALRGVTFSVRRGETLGIVGESGCGKSTLARALVRLLTIDDGRIMFDGDDVLSLKGADLRQYNRRVQLVFQDPFSSLNPRMTVGQTLREALAVHNICAPSSIPQRIADLLVLVGLPRDSADRFPFEFSGGQRQRIGIARALSVEPECLIADEIVSALDVSIQAQIINLLMDLQARLKLTLIFVSHDLRVVRYVSHRVAVMYLGMVVEVGETENIFKQPIHPYTSALLAAAPDLDPAKKSTVDAVQGELPSALNVPMGCSFHPRCPKAVDLCRTHAPAEIQTAGGHSAACHLPNTDPIPLGNTA